MGMTCSIECIHGNIFCPYDLFSVFQIVKNWVKQLTRLKGYTDQMVQDANALIVTFGSYRLGVSLLDPVHDMHIFMLFYLCFW